MFRGGGGLGLGRGAVWHHATALADAINLPRILRHDYLRPALV